MASKNTMKLIDVYRTDDPVIDRWTFVFDKRDLLTGYLAMLATDCDGRTFSQWTEGFYDSEGANSHLGARPRLIGETLVNHVLRRMLEGGEYNTSALNDFLERTDMPQE